MRKESRAPRPASWTGPSSNAEVILTACSAGIEICLNVRRKQGNSDNEADLEAVFASVAAARNVNLNAIDEYIGRAAESQGLQVERCVLLEHIRRLRAYGRRQSDRDS